MRVVDPWVRDSGRAEVSAELEEDIKRGGRLACARGDADCTKPTCRAPGSRGIAPVRPALLLHLHVVGIRTSVSGGGDRPDGVGAEVEVQRECPDLPVGPDSGAVE